MLSIATNWFMRSKIAYASLLFSYKNIYIVHDNRRISYDATNEYSNNSFSYRLATVSWDRDILRIFYVSDYQWESS